MKKLLLALGAVGVGGGAFFLFTRSALASEDATGHALTLPEAKAIQVPPGTPSSLGTKAIEVGLRYVGTKEDPKGSNRGPVVDQIIRGVHNDGESLIGKAWCARFCRFCFEKAAEEMNLPPPFAGIKDSLAAVTSWRDDFKAYAIAEPKPGAVALIISTGGAGIDKGHRHAVLVVRVDGDKVVSVEGNHADSVAVVSRPKTDFAVFLDIDRYVADKKPLVAGVACLGLDVFSAGRAG